MASWARTCLRIISRHGARILRRRRTDRRRENGVEVRGLKQANAQLRRELNQKEKAFAEASGTSKEHLLCSANKSRFLLSFR
jgi:hypothetical protein